MSEELKPCPFCGASDAFVERADLSACNVVCNNCGARGPVCVDETAADADASESDACDPGELPARRAWDERASFATSAAGQREGCEGEVAALPSHPRENVRPAYTDTMIDLLDRYEQAIWKWAQGCEVDGIRQRSQTGDSYNEGQRDDAAKARSALIRQIDALTDAEVARLAASPSAPEERRDAECVSSPDGRHQVDTSMESGPNNCFYCEAPMGGSHAR